MKRNKLYSRLSCVCMPWTPTAIYYAGARAPLDPSPPLPPAIYIYTASASISRR